MVKWCNYHWTLSLKLLSECKENRFLVTHSNPHCVHIIKLLFLYAKTIKTKKNSGPVFFSHCKVFLKMARMLSSANAARYKRFCEFPEQYILFVHNRQQLSILYRNRGHCIVYHPHWLNDRLRTTVIAYARHGYNNTLIQYYINTKQH